MLANKKHWLFILFIVLVSSCKQDDSVMPMYKPQIVVDGWIEQNGLAHVFVTQTTQYDSYIDSSSYFKTVLTHAKVILRTDSSREVLTLLLDQAYFPPHHYRSVKTRGKVGKKYYLDVILNGDTVSAETSIPQPPLLKKLYFEYDENDPEMGFIWIGVQDPAQEENYYRLFTRVIGSEKRFIATYISVMSDIRFNGQYTEFPLYHGLQSNTDKSPDYRFAYGDSVSVRFCSISKETYQFWSSFENEMLNSNNPFANGGTNLVSNIKGGIGIWCGYGASYYKAINKDRFVQNY